MTGDELLAACRSALPGLVWQASDLYARTGPSAVGRLGLGGPWVAEAYSPHETGAVWGRSHDGSFASLGEMVAAMRDTRDRLTRALDGAAQPQPTGDRPATSAEAAPGPRMDLCVYCEHLRSAHGPCLQSCDVRDCDCEGFHAPDSPTTRSR